jgi:phage terminase small subunit
MANRKIKTSKAGTGRAAAAARKALFVEAYIANGGNAKQAAVVAGYSPHTAKQQGQRLLTNVDLAAEVSRRRAEVMAKVAENTEVTKEWITASLKMVAERCLQAAPVLDRKGDRVLTETPSGDLVPAFEFNAAGANRALELLGKEQGMFIERTMVIKDPLEKFSPAELREFYAVLKARQEARKALQPASAVH